MRVSVFLYVCMSRFLIYICLVCLLLCLRVHLYHVSVVHMCVCALITCVLCVDQQQKKEKKVTNQQYDLQLKHHFISI